jgi:hypothetical protein
MIQTAEIGNVTPNTRLIEMAMAFMDEYVSVITAELA